MKMLNPRYAFATLAISGIAAGASLFGTGIASADMIDDLSPLLGSTCSFKQIDAAMHVSAPEMAARLDASPVQKGVLEMAYNVPMETRTKAFQEFSAQKQKNGMDTALAASPDLGTKMSEVAKTCQTYTV
ncbi:hemophore-related protein [Nocardia sp. CA-128927]|uniref:hemophore-related protein n=1 Tax=Nocardia sp. CA-128927 TaxID=3239975 RepID=UPI003D98288E